MLNQQLEFKERQERINASNGITKEDGQYYISPSGGLCCKQRSLSKAITSVITNGFYYKVNFVVFYYKQWSL